jgi:hypothetical protein
MSKQRNKLFNGEAVLARSRLATKTGSKSKLRAKARALGFQLVPLNTAVFLKTLS